MIMAPIRSPVDMQRAQARLVALAGVRRDTREELEYAALRDAVEHYRCITEWAPAAVKAAWQGPDAIEIDPGHQSD